MTGHDDTGDSTHDDMGSSDPASGPGAGSGQWAPKPDPAGDAAPIVPPQPASPADRPAVAAGSRADAAAARDEAPTPPAAGAATGAAPAVRPDITVESAPSPGKRKHSTAVVVTAAVVALAVGGLGGYIIADQTATGDQGIAAATEFGTIAPVTDNTEPGRAGTGSAGSEPGTEPPAQTMLVVTLPPTTAPPATTTTTQVTIPWQQTVAVAPPASGPFHLAADGIHLVGVDIPAGLYISTGDGSNCYWETNRIGSTDIEDNHYGAAGGTVRLTQGLQFETSRCGMWAHEDAPQQDTLEFTDSFWYGIGGDARDLMCADFERAASAQEISDTYNLHRIVEVLARDC